jgi:hypothetical protein
MRVIVIVELREQRSSRNNSDGRLVAIVVNSALRQADYDQFFSTLKMIVF